MRSVCEMPIGQSAALVEICGEAALARRLIEMGFHRGCMVQVISHAPFGGPIVVRIHESVVALRRSEAECLRVSA